MYVLPILLVVFLLAGCASVGSSIGSTLTSLPSVICPVITSGAIQQLESDVMTQFKDGTTKTDIQSAVALVGSGSTAACHIIQAIQAQTAQAAAAPVTTPLVK